ncbi:hypothetical protein [Paenisporosarcina quisquiliarum]|uniref:hypothetical protein n=1 Tax=Paenisporosarcina quisquiliarum TaxID=365346 RepID=UPI003736B2CA
MNFKKYLYIVFTIVLLSGCNPSEKNYQLWVDPATSSQETVDSSIERLTKAKIDFIVHENGSIFVNERDIDKAIMCCS